MAKVIEIPLAEIIVGTNRSAEISPNDSIKILAQSIKAEGCIKKPLVVRAAGNKYELVCGLKRLKAAMMNGMSMVPCEVRYLNDNEAAVLALNDNIYPVGAL